MARNAVFKLFMISTLAGTALQGAAQAADAITDTSAESAVRFVLETQSGYSFLSDGGTDTLEDGEDKSFSTTGAVGRINIQASEHLNIQGDIFGDYAWISDDADDSYQSQLGGGLHLYGRNDMGSLGVFGALGDVSIADDDGADDGGLNYIAGAEAQFYQDNWTFHLQAGWLDSERSDDVDMIRDALFARGVVRHYFGADTLIQAEAAYVNGEMDDDDDDMDLWSVGARLQHRFDFWPGAFYVGYRGDFADQPNDEDPDDDDQIDSHTIQFGATYTFGSDSLQDNERNGAAMDLPAFMRWQGIAAGPLE